MECRSPIWIDKADSYVPCGHCIPCMSRIRRDWSTRLHFEHMASTTAYFVTLTYDEFNLPRSEDSGFPTLKREDVQLYFKEIRNALRRMVNGKRRSISSPRWLLVGEYGPTTGRPHYHFIIFNLPRELKDLLRTKWGKGHVKVARVNAKVINYVGKYHFTKSIHDHRTTSIEQPFRLCTKSSGGLGKQWLTPANISYARLQLDGRLRTPSGFQPIPRYYRDRIGYTSAERLTVRRTIEARMEEKFSQTIAELRALGYDDPYAELQIRELATIAKLQRKILKGLQI